ncbi:hypothetical protein PVOR_02661 [Paenibacillus vortex V453]|uniref:Uncharacterized protein n=2 Tax=Paenibacillus TaxID=44249 RepID=A0A2R9T1V4_9BACL|nr:hypothetical protein PVOR_02661 [Paenibacillus vortex V453]
MKEQAAASEVYSINRTSVSSKGDRPQTNQGEPALPVYTPPDIPFQTAGRQHGEEAEVGTESLLDQLEIVWTALWGILSQGDQTSVQRGCRHRQ